MLFKYFTLAAAVEPTELNPYGKEYLGTVQLKEQAMEAAKGWAERKGVPVDVTACCVNPDHNWTVRYHPDGRVEKLWQTEREED